MNEVSFEVLVIILLIVANGALSMAEIAVVSSRKARLQQRANEGNRNAQQALELANKPNDFLSTVQVGITLIGTLAGVLGGATLAKQLAAFLHQYPAVAPYSETIGLVAVVLAISYLALILGELVPKNLALSNPERVAAALAPAMTALSKVASPAVWFLSWSTSMVLRLLPAMTASEPPVTEEEIKDLLAEGAKHGTVEEAEQEMVEGVFRLGDRSVAELMRPALRVEWIDVEAELGEIRQLITKSVHSRFPVAKGRLDQFLGVVHVKDLLSRIIQGESLDIMACVRQPLILPETKPALEALEAFQDSGTQLALVVDEHGAVGGLITVTDIMQAVVGDLHGAGEPPGPTATQREDGSWLVDGRMHVDDFKERLDIRDLPDEEEGGFATVGGFVMLILGRVPAPADHFDTPGWRFEVMDMDGTRVDKVLVSRIPEATADQPL